LTKLQAECRTKEEEVLKQRSTMVYLDDTCVKLRSEIQHLKDELQMLAESLKFHRLELEERGKEERALKMDEQQAEKQLEVQRRVTEAQKQTVATEMERSKALEFVAHKCLKVPNSVFPLTSTLKSLKI
jgi:chromosome segregation ATPase